jgi:hypothetical protein
MLEVRKWIVLLHCIFILNTAGARYFYLSDAESVSLSGADVCYYSGMANPAGLSVNTGTNLRVCYGNRYMLPEPYISSLSGTLYAQGGSFHSSLDYFGNINLNECRLSLAYGRKIFRWMDAGVRLNYYRFSAGVLSRSDQTITGEIGLLILLSDEVCLGLLYVNPTGSGYPGEAKNTETFIRLGISYYRNKNFYSCMQFSLAGYQELTLSAGFEYFLVKQFVIRTGLQIGSCLSYSCGIGFQGRKMNFSLGIQKHTVLGTSSAVSLTYFFKENE